MLRNIKIHYIYVYEKNSLHDANATEFRFFFPPLPHQHWFHHIVVVVVPGRRTPAVVVGGGVGANRPAACAYLDGICAAVDISSRHCDTSLERGRSKRSLGRARRPRLRYVHGRGMCRGRRSITYRLGHPLHPAELRDLTLHDCDDEERVVVCKSASSGKDYALSETTCAFRPRFL